MAVRFKLDENMPGGAVEVLQRAGHDVHTAIGKRLGGHPDPIVFDACQIEQRVLVTFDLYFADIRAYPPAEHCGIWVLRPRSQSIENTLSLLQDALSILDREPVAQRLWIIEVGQIRIRE